MSRARARSWTRSSECFVTRIAPRPVLFIAAGAREGSGYWLVRHYYEQASEPRQWWHVPEAGHGRVPRIRREEYEQRIVGFFDKALLEEGH